MRRSDTDRVFGVETEFGCLVEDESLTPEACVEAIKDSAFHGLRLGVIDAHARDDVFEPANSGGFLMNGGRLYVDAVGSHLEYATAECRSLADLVANDRAGQRIALRALEAAGLQESVRLYNNSVDHFGGHTFGCHENYLVRADTDLLNEAIQHLYPFLVTRQIFAGVGRVGGHLLTGGLRPSYQEVMENPIDYIWVSQVYGVIPDPTVRFQLSQRADHILKTVASRVRFNRAMINPKWEHFYSHEGTTRLHLLFGEANQNEFAYALKIGATSLAICLLERGLTPCPPLANPMKALRDVSRDETCRWLVELEDGTQIGAIELQRLYLKAAQRFRGESEQTDWVLDSWESTLEGLERDPLGMGDRIDWVAKRRIIETYMAENGLDWDADALHSVDLEYHNIDPEQSLFHAWQLMGRAERVVSEAAIVAAISDPPSDTRAKGRGRLVEKVLRRKGPRFYLFDWNGVALDRHTYIEMSDPYETYSKED